MVLDCMGTGLEGRIPLCLIRGTCVKTVTGCIETVTRLSYLGDSSVVSCTVDNLRWEAER
jgi:hypothetical protein